MPTATRKLPDTSLTSEQLAHWSQSAIDVWNPVSAALGAWNAQLPAICTSLGQEWSDFVLRRLKEDAELPLRLAASRTPEEFWDRYAGFWSKLAADYRREWDALARLGNQRMQQSLDLFKSVVDPHVDDAAAHAARR